MKATWLRYGTLAVAMSMAGAMSYAQTAGGGTQSGSSGSGTTEGGATQGGTTQGGSTQGGEAQGGGAQRGQGSGAKEKQFAQKMMIANMAEVQLGQIGVERATSPEVKSFAQMMVTDHSQANQELMPIAQQLGVQQPAQLDPKHRAVADKLSKLQGAEFDRQFMKTMVDAHKDVLKDTKSMAGKQGASGTSGASGTTGTSGASGSSGTSGSSGSGGSSGAAGTSGSTGGGSTSGSAGGSSMGSSSASASGATATSVNAYAAKTLPIVQQHLEHAQHLQQGLAK